MMIKNIFLNELSNYHNSLKDIKNERIDKGENVKEHS